MGAPRKGCRNAEESYWQGHRISAGAYLPTVTLYNRWQIPDRQQLYREQCETAGFGT